MAWTAPRTWVVGEVPTAAMFNANVRDNLLETAPAKATTAGRTFRATGGSALAETSDLTVSADGEVQTPRQPAFLAYNSADDDNVTGTGQEITVDVDTEVFDLGGDFAADIFTAPVTGKYRFEALVTFHDLDGSPTGYLELSTSNRNYRFGLNIPSGISTFNLHLAATVDMDANDTAKLRLYVSNCLGVVVDVNGGAAPVYTFFSGELVA